MQTGVGAYAYGLAEIAVKNQAGNFVSLTGVAGSQRGNYLQALPRQPPSPSASWAGVNLNWGRGATVTHPPPFPNIYLNNDDACAQLTRNVIGD